MGSEMCIRDRPKYVRRLEEASLGLRSLALLRWGEMRKQWKDEGRDAEGNAAAALLPEPNTPADFAEERPSARRGARSGTTTAVSAAAGAAGAAAASSSSPSWPFPHDCPAAFGEFARIYRRVGVSRLNELADEGKDLEWIWKQLLQKGYVREGDQSAYEAAVRSPEAISTPGEQQLSLIHI